MKAQRCYLAEEIEVVGENSPFLNKWHSAIGVNKQAFSSFCFVDSLLTDFKDILPPASVASVLNGWEKQTQPLLQEKFVHLVKMNIFFM